MFEKLDITGLSLITACGCNLSCDYCRIAQSVNSAAPILQKNTIEALKDGSFLKNTLNVLEVLHGSPYRIQSIALWGQEPTLTLKYLTMNLKDWVTSFPNVQSFMFSTNGIDYVDDIIDFILELDKNLCHNLEFNIQYSFDGTESTNNIRNADSLRIFNNLNKLLTTLNMQFLNHIQLHIFFHGVCSLELISRLNSIEKIVEYYKNLNDWTCHFINLNNNKNVKIDEAFSLGLENPVNASTVDGLALADFYKKSIKLDWEKILNNNYFAAPFSLTTLLQRAAEEVLTHFSCSTLDILFNKIKTQQLSLEEVCLFVNHSMYCGNNVNELKIMYDGTLINCQNHIFETEEKYIQPTDDLSYEVKKSLAKHHYFVNPLKDDISIVEKNFSLFLIGKESSFYFTFQNLLMLMFYLARSKQIDEKYKNDYDLMIKHCFLATLYASCAYNNYIQTGSLYLKPASILRLLCNGFIDYGEIILNLNERKMEND